MVMNDVVSWFRADAQVPENDHSFPEPRCSRRISRLQQWVE